MFKKENLIFEKSKLFKNSQGKTVWIKNKFNRNSWKQSGIKSKATKVVTEIELEWYQDKSDCEIQNLKCNVTIKLRVGNREETRVEMIFGSDISEWLCCG